MTKEIKITSWVRGFNKVKYVCLLREYCGLSLSQAKQDVDGILEGKIIIAKVMDNDVETFLIKSKELGAICSLDV